MNATFDIGSDFQIKRIRNRTEGGAWVIGTLNGHRFDALVFAGHAEVETYELGRSRISKLWIKRLADKRTVANFDRGWDIRPTDDLAAAIVEFLEVGLAYHLFGK